MFRTLPIFRDVFAAAVFRPNGRKYEKMAAESGNSVENGSVLGLSAERYPLHARGPAVTLIPMGASREPSRRRRLE